MAFSGVPKGDLRAYFVGLLVCIGGFLFGYDTGVVGKANPNPSPILEEGNY